MLQGQDWELAKRHARLVAKAWLDAALRERLLAEPAAVLREHGFDVPAGTEVKIVEQAEGTIDYGGGVIRFALPARPDGEIGDERLPEGVVIWTLALLGEVKRHRTSALPDADKEVWGFRRFVRVRAKSDNRPATGSGSPPPLPTASV
jgi:Nitrile hydratase, alpha chain